MFPNPNAFNRPAASNQPMNGLLNPVAASQNLGQGGLEITGLNLNPNGLSLDDVRNEIRSQANGIRGEFNFVQGKGNGLIGSDNVILGDRNGIIGDENIITGSRNGI